jgi:hypothetical protein
MVACARALEDEIRDCQRQDVVYWSPIIDELRVMRKKKQLLPEGSLLQ